MKRILAGLIFVLTVAHSPVRAETVDDLVGLGMNAALAEYIAANVAGGATLSNAAWFAGRNQAGTADINLFRVDTGDNTVINSSASDILILQLEDDANRILSFDGSADTLVELFWGDGGTTAAQNFDIHGGTSDADDDQRFCASGGGACADLSRGAYVYVEGEQDAGGGDAALAGQDDVLITATDDIVLTSTGLTSITATETVDLVGADVTSSPTDDHIVTAGDDIVLQGDGAGDIITLAGGGTAVDLTVADDLITVASGTALTMTSGNLTLTAGDAILTSGDLTFTSGAVNIAAATNLGFIDEDAGNTACDTTCTAGCLIGYDAGANKLVDCADATADSCACAGAAS